MSDTNMIKIRNESKRVYNWVRPYQIIEIDEKNFFHYKNAGFVVFNNTPSESLDEIVVEEEAPEDLEARIEYLKSINHYDGRRGWKKIVSESDTLGYDEDDTTEVDEDDIEALDDIETGEDEDVEEVEIEDEEATEE